MKLQIWQAYAAAMSMVWQVNAELARVFRGMELETAA